MRAATSTLAAFANGFLTVFCEVMPSRPRIAPRARPPNAPVPPEKRVSTQTPNMSCAAGSPSSPAECLEKGKRRGLVSRAGARRSSNMVGGLFWGDEFLNRGTRNAQGHSLTVHRGTHGHTHGTQKYTGVHRGTQGYTWIYRGTLGYTGIHRGTQGYTGVHRGTQGYTAHELYIHSGADASIPTLLFYTNAFVQRSAQAVPCNTYF